MAEHGCSDESYYSSALWRIRRTREGWNGITIAVPTVHPNGDQRVLRCAQALHDDGYGIHLIWMGGDPGTTIWDETLAETRLTKADSTMDRMKALRKLARLADRVENDAWHIHDFYMLPFALVQWLRRRRPTIYDVHEYYPEYYAEKVPGLIKPVVKATVEYAQLSATARLGGANVAAEELAKAFRARGIATSVTPNFPSWAGDGELVAPRLGPLSKVIHTGSLTPAYGSYLLVEVARRLETLGSEITLDLVARFPSNGARDQFHRYLRRFGQPANLGLIHPVPAHEIPHLLSSYGIGISALQEGGQNELAVPTKLYEYVRAGLAVVASDLAAQASFVTKCPAGRIVSATNVDEYVNAIRSLGENVSTTMCDRRAGADYARTELSWELVAVPELQRLARAVIGS